MPLKCLLDRSLSSDNLLITVTFRITFPRGKSRNQDHCRKRGTRKRLRRFEYITATIVIIAYFVETSLWELRRHFQKLNGGIKCGIELTIPYFKLFHFSLWRGKIFPLCKTICSGLGKWTLDHWKCPVTVFLATPIISSCIPSWIFSLTCDLFHFRSQFSHEKYMNSQNDTLGVSKRRGVPPTSRVFFS